MNQCIRRCAVFLLSLLASTWLAVGSAHHAESSAPGASSKSYGEWSGKIQYVSWDGAHVMYRIDVENADHQVESWQVLGASPKVLAMRHITKSTIRSGDVVTVNGYLNPYSKIISPLYFTTADGHKYAIGFEAM